MIGVHTLKYVNDQAYVVKHEIGVTKFAIKGTDKLNMELVQAYMKWQGCDHVLRSQTHFMFCETIEDAIEEEYWELDAK
tara:strand:+ start:463 stop:699 length:237 start_codon:yes stop_codon:yes gene_type:complete